MVKTLAYDSTKSVVSDDANIGGREFFTEFIVSFCELCFTIFLERGSMIMRGHGKENGHHVILHI